MWKKKEFNLACTRTTRTVKNLRNGSLLMRNLSFFTMTILKTLTEKLTSVMLFSRFSKPFETCHNNE